MDNPAYRLTEKLLPVANLAVWTGAAVLSRLPLPPLKLGLLWVVLAALVDFVAFVAIPHPVALGAYDFYVGQAPWLYLTYLAVFASPLLAAVITRRRSSLNAARL